MLHACRCCLHACMDEHISCVGCTSALCVTQDNYLPNEEWLSQIAAATASLAVTFNESKVLGKGLTGIAHPLDQVSGCCKWSGLCTPPFIRSEPYTGVRSQDHAWVASSWPNDAALVQWFGHRGELQCSHHHLSCPPALGMQRSNLLVPSQPDNTHSPGRPPRSRIGLAGLQAQGPECHQVLTLLA